MCYMVKMQKIIYKGMEWLPLRQYAKSKGVNRKTVYDWIKKKEVISLKIDTLTVICLK